MAQNYPCMITDSRGNPLSRGVLESAPSESVWQVRVLDGGIGRVQEHTVIHLIGMADELPGMKGSIIDSREDDVLVVERISPLGIAARQNLRVPVRFDSFLYPVSGVWKGRRSIVSLDLSCGGIAFFCDPTPKLGEVIQLVIPITAQPLLLKAKIIRHTQQTAGGIIVSAEFADLIHDEEVLVREAVFSQQIRNRTTE